MRKSHRNFSLHRVARVHFLILVGGTIHAAPPQRIVTIGPNAAETLCALGACGAIVGVDKFCLFPPELSDRPRVGGLFDPDLERIIALNPDLVVLRGRNQSVEQLCQRRNIRLYMDRTERIVDIEKGTLEMATLLERPDEGLRLAEQFKSRLDTILKRTAGRAQPRVLLTVSRRPDTISNILTTGKGTFLDEILDIAGGHNIFGDMEVAWPQVSPEAFLTLQPDVIIELMPGFELTESSKSLLLSTWKQFGALPAVAAGQIHIITETNALVPSLRYTEIVDRIEQILASAITHK